MTQASSSSVEPGAATASGDGAPAPGSDANAGASAKASILFVDDEANILSSLRRLFRTSGYQVQIADGGEAALKILQSGKIDVVVSDMRMPGMSGAELLGRVREQWPETMRLLLTGQADMASIAEAINTGEIYRYINKPWDESDILSQVHQAVEHQALVREKARLQTLSLQQTEQLRQLNTSLEAKVAARTSELAQANERLKNSFLVGIKVFSTLIEMRGDGLAGHARRVAILARTLARRMGLGETAIQEVFVAGLLHEIGKIGFNDTLLGTPVSRLSPFQLQEYRQHPSRAEALLMPLQELQGAVTVIAAQLERVDGGGHPNHLRGDAIPIGARILALASDYDNLQMGVLVPRKLTPAQAQVIIERSSTLRYDPQVVEAFSALQRGDAPVVELPAQPQVAAMVAAASDLRPGMVLARDLIGANGLMMLSATHVLDEPMIQKLLDFEKSFGVELTVHIVAP
ncbi:MAG: response regulator [Rhodoferax sp.]|nr:response regulator [Rhodoferax sp.]HRA62430.1 response regulator [Burkholderiaceae bacterium]